MKVLQRRNSTTFRLCARRQNSKTAVPLDTVPERRTERCSRRFRPSDRFCKLRIRYQSSPTGSEREISRPLDHMWQIPFIHSTRISLYVTDGASYFLHVVHWSVFWCGIFGNYACNLAETLISRFEAIIQIMLCFMRYVVVLQEKKRLFLKWKMKKVPS